MKTLTTPVSVVNVIATIGKISVVQFVDHDDVSPPWAEVHYRVFSQGGNKQYPGAGAQFDFVLAAFDANPCLCLGVNAASMTASDQLQTFSTTLSGTPYTTISNAANAATGKNAIRIAVEDACQTVGLVTAALAGS